MVFDPKLSVGTLVFDPKLSVGSRKINYRGIQKQNNNCYYKFTLLRLISLFINSRFGFWMVVLFRFVPLHI